MHSVFKKTTITVFSLMLTIVMFSSCSDDIIIPPLDSLLGEYAGHYTRTDMGQGGSSGVPLADISMIWIFRDFTYELDDTSTTICSPSGEYVLSGDQINLEESFDGNSGGVCDPSLNPIGDFSIRRPEDSLILTQLVDEIRVEIRLKKVQ